MAELTDTERAILEWETTNPTMPQGRRSDFAVGELQLSPTRYHQVLGALLDRPEALTAFPTTVNRLRRIRDERRARRNKPMQDWTSSHDPRGYERRPAGQASAW